MKVIWNESFSVGNEVIDGQHKKLVEMLNEANDILETIKDNQDAYTSIEHLLKELVDYTIYHFDFEENLMVQAEYPGITEHVEEHNKFKIKLTEIIGEDFSVDPFTKTNDLLKFLFKWLINHINYNDKKYSKYI